MATKKKLDTLESKVLRILEEDKTARDDDRLLTVRVHMDYYGIDPFTPYWEVMCDRTLPSQESIGRCRRKIQETRFDLRGSDEKEAFRMAEQEVYIEYARGDI